MARPQTHDLILETIAQLNARLARVEVVNLKEDVFYGNLVIEKGDQIIQIDAGLPIRLPWPRKRMCLFCFGRPSLMQPHCC